MFRQSILIGLSVYSAVVSWSSYASTCRRFLSHGADIEVSAPLAARLVVDYYVDNGDYHGLDLTAEVTEMISLIEAMPKRPSSDYLQSHLVAIVESLAIVGGDYDTSDSTANQLREALKPMFQ